MYHLSGENIFMRKKFMLVRVYNDIKGYQEPYTNIEFVIDSGFTWQVAEYFKKPFKKGTTRSKYDDNLFVVCPQNYEEFKKCLAQTQINEYINDIRVVYERCISRSEEYNVALYCENELLEAGYDKLVKFAAELFYDEKERAEKNANHKKRTFINQANKIHKELLDEYNSKLQK